MASGSQDTIYAISSGRGRSAIAVVRVSGPQCSRIVLELAGYPLPAARRAVLRSFRAPEPIGFIDRGMLIWLPGPGSATGEDMAEFHVHGGRAVLDALLGALTGLSGARPAEAGEFSKRAFFHGKFDLVQAEAIADLIAAETEAQRRQALRQMEGHQSATYEGWRRQLIQVMAEIEADIDFADQDLPFSLGSRAVGRLAALEAEMARHLEEGHKGELVRDGVRVAILGAPNVGKSSLLNALAKRDVAIVHDRPGTTRDVVEVRLSIAGQLVTVMDTAGIRDAEDPVEREGIVRAELAGRLADISLVVVDGQGGEAPGERVKALIDDRSIVVISKADLCFARPNFGLAQKEFWVSAKTGDGLDQLLSALGARVDAMIGKDEGAPLTRARHRTAIRDARAAVHRALEQDQIELCAEEIRLSANALGRLVGVIEVDDILDRVFSEFCIGK